VSSSSSERTAIVRVDGGEHLLGRWCTASLLIVFGPPLAAFAVFTMAELRVPALAVLPTHAQEALVVAAFVLGQLAVAGALSRFRGTRPWVLGIAVLPGLVIGAAIWSDAAWRAGAFLYPLLAASYAVLAISGVARTAIPWLEAARIRLALDRDGLRVEQSSSCSYWPNELLGAARVEPEGCSPARLIVTLRGGHQLLELPLLNATALENARELARRTRALACEPHTPGTLPLLPRRRALALEEWISCLERLVPALDERAAYRQIIVRRDELLELFETRGAPLDLRAGAGYLLLRAHPAAARRHPRPAIDAASAPLVLALAALATSHVPKPWLESVTPFLDEDDRRTLWRALTEVRSGGTVS
jgi:hypothetical protein